MIRDDRIIIISKSDSNKKNSKDTVFASWTDNTGMKSDGTGVFEWELGLKSELLVKDTMKKHRLDKLLKEVYPQTGEIWRYTPFPPGTLPKMLVKKTPQQPCSFISKAPEKDHIHKCIQLAGNCSTCSLVWIVKLAPQHTPPRLEPIGLAFTSNKQLVLPGNGHLMLE